MISSALIDKFLSIFNPMESLQSYSGSNMISNVMQYLLDTIVIGIINTFTLHPKGNGTVERFNQPLARYLTRFLEAESMYWDEHFHLTCFRYNAGICKATIIKSLKEFLGVYSFEEWSEMDLDYTEL